MTDDEAARNFEAFCRHAGMAIPPDRRAALAAGYAELAGVIALVHQKRPASSEPAGIYALAVIERLP